MPDHSKDRWPRARDILYQALELPPAERDAFVRSSTGSERGLTQYVLELLAIATSDEGDPVPVGVTAPDFVDAAFSDGGVIQPAAGERVGSYSLIRRIGEGGMGSVFLGERADGDFEQKVAIKFVRDRARSETVRDRFRVEEQILAGLVHPGIARLYDGGVTETGHPYFVMEYVEGVPITTYCTDNALSIDDRLDLFLQICDAASYAQQHLVVHRDVKPSNILVTGAGRVKLLDFGIAKVIDPLQQDATQTVARFLTPLYAAPEQLTAGRTTTATDVFSLGVVLYEMLAGRLPYNSSNSHAAIVRAVCDESPPLPSQTARVRRAEESEFVDDPGTRKLRNRLRGDLDAIVLTALRKEPAQRYNSAQALGDDVRRYREGTPVRARRQTRWYRARRFVRRHRLGSALTAAALIVFATFAVVLLQQRQAVIKERNLLINNDKVSQVISKIFRADLTSEAAVLESIDRAADEASVEYASDPKVLGDALQILGQIARRMSLERGLSLQERSYAVFRQHFGESNEDAIYVLDEQATIHGDLGNLAAADSLSERAVNLGVRENVRAVWMLHRSRGYILSILGRDREAVDELRLARGFANGPQIEDAIAWAFMKMGELDSAEVTIRQSLAESPYDEHDPRTLNTWRILTSILVDKRDYAGAESLATRSIALARDAPGSFGDQTFFIVAALRSAAAIRTALRDFVGADSLINEARALAMTRPDFLGTPAFDALDLDRAKNSMLLGRPDEAEEVLDDLMNRTANPGVAVIAGIHMADLHLDAGRFEEMLALQPSLILGVEGRGEVAILLATALIESGDLPGAEHAVLESHRSEDPTPEHTARLLVLRARIALEGDDLESARRLAQGAINIVESLQTHEEGLDKARARSLLGKILTEERRYDEAEPMLTGSYSFLREWYGPRSSYDLRLAAKRVRNFYRNTGRPMPDSLFK